MIPESVSQGMPTQLTQPSQQLKSSLWKSSLSALLYKNATIYRKNYCSNLCQILTPLLCLGFTIVVRMVSEQVTTGNVGSFPFPQPFHMPIVYQMLPGLKIKCSEKYYYSFLGNQSSSIDIKERSQHIFNRVLKTYCSETDGLVPEFIYSQDPNQRIIEELRVSDLSPIERGIDMNTSLPDGKVILKALSPDSLQAMLSINDWRLPEYHKNNGVTKLNLQQKDRVIVTYLKVTEGLMSLVQKLTRSYLQMLDSDGKEIIVGNYLYMPFDGVDKSLINKATNVLGSGLYALGLSLLFPIFLYSIVSDKEERLIEIMKMNGLLMKYYWIAFFAFNFCLSFLSGCFLFAMGRYVLEITFFSSTAPQIYFLLLTGWSIAQVSLTAFVQVFINSSKTATIVGYLLSIFSALVGQAICNVVYPFPSQLPVLMLLYPPWALARGIYLIGYACANNSDCYQDIRHLSNEMYTVLMCLFSWLAIFFISTYLHEIVQQQYGTSNLPMCLQKNDIQESVDQIGVRETKHQHHISHGEEENDKLMPSIDPQLIDPSQLAMTQGEADVSVHLMAELTKDLQPHQRPLLVKKLYKTYDNGHQALKRNSFCLEEKEIFGLLGPNGAGKTTLMSVLTGLYKATGGAAWVDGSEIGGRQTNLRVGVCPQFDLLWDNMTISEHMYFYSLLKGVPITDLDESVSSLLKDVDLLNERDLKSCELSGGMRRRLSLAIALTGKPRVVFLDQPSSGLDPSHRRQMWDILLRCKDRTTIFLTTHLMEEAEALCDRIGIINKGLLRCVGTQKELKSKFGKGYRLTINFKEWRGEQTIIVNEMLGLGCEVVNDLSSRVMLKVPKEKMLECVRKLKQCDSLSWLLSQPSLYDVFMYFVQ